MNRSLLIVLAILVVIGVVYAATVTKSASVTVNNPLAIGSVQWAVVINTPVTLTIPVSGGIAPYTCTISAGALPAGLVLSGAGNCFISGTPTTAGTFTFSITVSDSAGAATTVQAGGAI